ncbi:MAG: NHL repeat-containing protein [Chloroflexi bacterium]|nr:NHL repeat-containing protein [Chloroflexota bacterium]
MATQAKPTYKIGYLTTVGFTADFGGRGFHLPVDMAVRDDGHIFVLSRSSPVATPGMRIVETDLKHKFYGEFGGFGTDPGQFTRPSALAIGPNNHLFVADDSLNRITEFDGSNNYVRHWGTAGDKPGHLSGPSGLAFNRDGDLMVVDHLNHRVQTFTMRGKYLGQFGAIGHRRSQFNLPWGIDVGPDGQIYVADWRNDRIQRFAPDGEFIDSFGGSGSADGKFNRPSDVAVGPDGYIYVADWMNQRVQVFDTNWKFKTKLRGQATLSPWATEYLDANQDEFRARQSFQPVIELDTTDPHEVSARIESYFWDPIAVQVDRKGRLYVLETNRHRFQVYQSSSS